MEKTVFDDYTITDLEKIYYQMLISKMKPDNKEDYKDWTYVFDNYYITNLKYNNDKLYARSMMEIDLVFEIARRFGNLYRSGLFSGWGDVCKAEKIDLEDISRNYYYTK